MPLFLGPFGEPYFNPDDIKDERQKTSTTTVIRRGQKRFKRQLLACYGGRCCITGCDVVPVLEAAHILPYLGPKTNHPSNGLLLRADIHKLFDHYYFSIHLPTYQVVIAPTLKNTSYSELAGQPLRLPASPTGKPNPQALFKHYQTFCCRRLND